MPGRPSASERGGKRDSGASRTSAPARSRDGSPGGAANPVLLIRACRDTGSLLALLEAEAEGWSRDRNAFATATALSQASKLSTGGGTDAAQSRDVFAILSAAYLPLVEGLLDAAACTIPLHACAKAGYWGGGLAAALLQRLIRDGGELLGTANSQSLSNLWWSLSEALKSAEGRHVLSSIDLPRLLEASVGPLLRGTDLSAQACANILLACVRLQWGNNRLIHHLTARLVELGAEASEQALANALYALGELAEDSGNAPRPEDLQGLAWAVEQRLSGSRGRSGEVVRHRFTVQALSNMLLGCAKLGFTDPGFLSPLVATAGKASPRMDPQALANSLYSLALLEPSVSAHGGAAEALAEECKRRRFTGFTPQAIANSAWALAKMGYADQGWYAAAVEAAGQQGAMKEAMPQAWSNLWYALALVRHRPASGRLLERTAEAAGPLCQRGKGQGCANLLWALANLRLYDERLVGALAGRLGELLGQGPGELDAQGLCNSLWALAVMGPDVLSRHSGLVEGLLREAESQWAAEGGRAYTEEGLVQLWYVQLELVHVGGGELQRILGAGEGREGSLLGATRAAAEKAATEETRESAMERQVASALERLAQRLGPGTLVSVQRGCVVPGLGRAADVVVELAGGRRVAVEVDGPSHFLANRARDPDAIDGSTELRNRQLGRLFGQVVSVLFAEWEFKGASEQEEVLCRLLGISSAP
ncbi:hypothetical protein HYH03_004123 [Edaphochlamys debaryana]|uniref:RAP domain-containing protein n=1 Tax=Edaphochlamys debaryana TaxID=47281 RepID=A0A835YAD0_9CHLO|nr:hypothetical protein HYH03_004123 [Edaphochlamys debaryana]|eukprot:KAG2497857.1 hypothetical protein HYH03_004123 [Edaphochlamys debaryana]